MTSRQERSTMRFAKWSEFMTGHDIRPSVFNGLTQRFCDWLNQRRELNELGRLSQAELNRVAGDLQISPANLTELVNHGPHAADELPELLNALGIDLAHLARAEPMALQDMERVCALCGHKRECDHDLAAGASADRYQRYCPNAPTIAGLGKPMGQ
jgi:uncharacterized protein YjiS (DUF1127 family)